MLNADLYAEVVTHNNSNNNNHHSLVSVTNYTGDEPTKPRNTIYYTGFDITLKWPIFLWNWSYQQ